MKTDFRRYFRPFFVHPATQKPTKYKIYYDLFSLLTTQIAFSFVTAPFVLLNLTDSYIVWRRVYFYAIIGTALSTAFFASPAKVYLKKQMDARAERLGVPANGNANAKGKGKLERSYSQESIGDNREPIMVLPPQPDGLEETLREIREEIEARQRMGFLRSETM